ncbi:MAG: esterase family protein [Phycisphaeraceae bacterium]|nr:esterase family protein [Phycisphaeraceae bacterium]
MALIHCDFFSEALGLQCAMYVVLPQATVAQIGLTGVAGRGKHKTLYLLHGLSDDHTIWLRRTSIERYAAERGLAVVMPAAHRSYYTDMVHGYKYFTHISQEIPALARQFFPLSEARADNFVAGLSMGGYGAFKIAMTYPERYAAAASLSGALDPPVIAMKTMPERKPEFENVFGPLDKVSGTENDVFHLATQLAGRDRKDWPALYQCCGTEDFLIEDNRRYRDHLKKVGLPAVYEEGPGVHDWAYWDKMIQRVLAWLPVGKG